MSQHRSAPSGARVTLGAFLVLTVVIIAWLTWVRAQQAAFWDPTGELGSAFLSAREPLAPYAALMAALMVAVGATAVALYRARLPVVAALTAMGAGAGPLSLLVVPLWTVWAPSPESASSRLTGTGWLVPLIGAVLGAVIAVAARLVAANREPGNTDRPVGPWGWTAAYGAGVLGVLAVLTLRPELIDDPGHGPLGPGMVLGWVLLCVGLACAGCSSQERLGPTSARTLFFLLLPAALWGLLARDGGWPSAPGWEYDPQLPLFLTTPLAWLVLASATLGWVGAAVRVILPGGAGREPVAVAAAGPPAADPRAAARSGRARWR